MGGYRSNADWWPNQLNLNILHQHSPLSNPMGESFNYAEEFKSLDLNAVIKDLRAQAMPETPAVRWASRIAPNRAAPNAPPSVLKKFSAPVATPR